MPRTWLSEEDYSTLSKDARQHYIRIGDEYRLRPTASERRQEKIALFVMAALMLIFSAVGVYAAVVDDFALEILAFCGAMPTLFGLLIQLMMYFSLPTASE